MADTWKNRNGFKLDWKMKLVLVVALLLISIAIGIMFGVFAGFEIAKTQANNQTIVTNNVSNFDNTTTNETIYPPITQPGENNSVNITIKPPETQNKDNVTAGTSNEITTINFKLTDGNSHQFNYTFDELNRSTTEGNYSREIIREYRKIRELYPLYEKFGSERVNRFNYSGFVQPVIHISAVDGTLDLDNYVALKDLNSIRPLAQYINSKSRRDYDFVKNVLYLKSQLGNYSYGIGEAKYPLENFVNGSGDSGDAAVFVGSMIKSVHPDWKVRLYAVNSNALGYTTTIANHFVLQVDNGNDVQMFIETTANDPSEAMQYYSGVTISGWYLEF
ncbi:MAG: hypothetical protein Q7S22_01495 [Candidatus Micrarchaeota archaeon]|nr:hypothetical protein [Candidatus Micrarchaeota archaeon]